jgi:hypothetical protein
VQTIVLAFTVGVLLLSAAAMLFRYASVKVCMPDSVVGASRLAQKSLVLLVLALGSFGIAFLGMSVVSML